MESRGTQVSAECCLNLPHASQKTVRLTFRMVAEGEPVLCPLEFAGKGRVIRLQPDPPGTGYVIALKCARPISCHRRRGPAMARKSAPRIRSSISGCSGEDRASAYGNLRKG